MYHQQFEGGCDKRWCSSNAGRVSTGLGATKFRDFEDHSAHAARLQPERGVRARQQPRYSSTRERQNAFGRGRKKKGGEIVERKNCRSREATLSGV